MRPFEQRNAHFDRLVNSRGLKWLGQNTNHATPHPAVIEAIQRCLADEEFHVYAPPIGFEALRSGIAADLDLPDQAVMVCDGAVAGLSHACKTLLGPGDELITTDPTWNWPMIFAKSVGATVRQIPIYGAEYGYRLAPERLAEAMSSKTKIVYLVDPNNPLGTSCTPEEIDAIANIIRSSNATLIHDCTYRHFAHSHTLAAKQLPERTLTVYSFSKWLGIAGLRVGAIVGSPDMAERLTAAQSNILGSNVLGQRAAIAALAVKDEWFPGVLAKQRDNQKMIKDAVDRVTGLHMPVFPSNGNFVVIECKEAGVRPEALAASYQERGIMIRQGSYHTPNFGDRFVKVSTTVPAAWIEEFVGLLPEMLDRARGLNDTVSLY